MEVRPEYFQLEITPNNTHDEVASASRPPLGDNQTFGEEKKSGMSDAGHPIEKSKDASKISVDEVADAAVDHAADASRASGPRFTMKNENSSGRDSGIFKESKQPETGGSSEHKKTPRTGR